MIALVDMNSFFAAIEQLDNPFWRGRPVAVTNGIKGTCCITNSYEARAYGIKTGTHIRQARALCPGIIQAPARPERYAEVSTKIMRALGDVTPTLEVFSVDEAFLDLTRCQSLYARMSPTALGRWIKEVVFEASGLNCSVGLSGDKTTAKWAAKLIKPNGLTVVPPWESEARLAPVPVTDLCGVKAGVGGFLAQRGVAYCGEMKRMPISVLAQRYGNPGRRVWLMAQGKDPEPVITTVKDPKTIGHGKVIPPDTDDRGVLATYLRHMAEKVGRRLRKYGFEAQTFTVGLMSRLGWIGRKFRLDYPTQDGQVIFSLGEAVLSCVWRGEGVFQVHIGALDPRPAHVQMDMFEQAHPKRQRVLQAIDLINSRYGEFSIMPAPLINRSTMPNVISPAWKPFGHRETIDY